MNATLSVGGCGQTSAPPPQSSGKQAPAAETSARSSPVGSASAAPDAGRGASGHGISNDLATPPSADLADASRAAADDERNADTIVRSGERVIATQDASGKAALVRVNEVPDALSGVSPTAERSLPADSIENPGGSVAQTDQLVAVTDGYGRPAMMRVRANDNLPIAGENVPVDAGAIPAAAEIVDLAPGEQPPADPMPNGRPILYRVKPQ